MWRNLLVKSFSTSTISWSLPPFSWRGPGIKQYQPAAFGWDPAEKKYPGKKVYKTTLIHDNFWVVDRHLTYTQNGVWWILEGDLWSENTFHCLDASLERMTYFGRAESITQIQRVESIPSDISVNCVLETCPSSESVPVLVPNENAMLEQVEAVTDDASIADSTIPPGAQWMYAKRPSKPDRKLPSPNPRVRQPTNLIQFAVGTRVSPTRKSTVVLTQRFRGRVIRKFLGGSWQHSNSAQREKARLLSGKEIDGTPLKEQRHPHARFGILFDQETKKATRLLVWREQPFSDEEQSAILNAAELELPISFAAQKEKDPWAVRLVPLDSQVLKPIGFGEQVFCRWKTVTPYVPPRYVYDRRGRKNKKELPEKQISRELAQLGYDTVGLSVNLNSENFEWVKVHSSRLDRRSDPDEPTNVERRGYYVDLTFKYPVRGPISLGHSSHFGLGLFAPIK